MPDDCDRSRSLVAQALLAALLAALVSVWAERHLLADPYSINDDARSSYRHTYPLAVDNRRPLDDYAREMLFRQRSLALTGLCWIAANAVPYVPMTKWFPVLLMALTAGMAWRVFRRLSGSAAAAYLLILVFTLHGWSAWTPYFRCGLTNSDILMFTCVGALLALMERRIVLLAVVLLLTAEVYAPGFVLVSATVGAWAILNLIRERTFPRFAMAAASVWGVAAILFLTKYVFTDGLNPQSLVTLDQMRTMPEFHAGGRTPMLFPGDWVARISNPRSGLGLEPAWWAVFCLAAFAAILSRGRALRRISAEVVALALAGLGLFAASNALLFRLFDPSRYVRFSIPLVLMCIAAAGLGRAMREGRWRRAFAVSATIAAVAFLAIRTHPPRSALRSPALAAYLSTLPADAVLAASPDLSDTLNVMANRNAYVSLELASPYFPQFYQPIRQRLFSFFDAYYSARPDGMIALCRSGEITHLIVDEADFESLTVDNHPVFYEPFGSRIEALVTDSNGERRPADDFAVYRLPTSAALFAGDGFRVYSCATLMEGDAGLVESAAVTEPPHTASE